EASPNAFATGRDPKHSTITLTKGIIEKLNKTELEGVIAHEMSHIKNRDTLLMTLVAVLVGTIAAMADWYLRINFWWGHDDNNQGNILFFIIGILATAIAYLSAILIQLSISRRREYLADASAVLLTRYPDGLISALKKISNDSSSLKKPIPSGVAHLFIVNPFKRKNFLVKLFSTHPPINERIAKLKEME
ncbi:MAG TPA: zinc metalloprotease HtpX, partial [Candidatus Portnoybacteria bacterium]|nr:zinc metalloprotease HtpX [Candidatus Portnoybacteria bacterium]